MLATEGVHRSVKTKLQSTEKVFVKLNAAARVRPEKKEDEDGGNLVTSRALGGHEVRVLVPNVSATRKN